MIPKIVIKQLNTHVFFYFEEWNKMLVQRCFNVYNVSTTFYNVYNVGTTLLQRLQCWHNVVQCLQVSTTLLQRLQRWFNVRIQRLSNGLYNKR